MKSRERGFSYSLDALKDMREIIESSREVACKAVNIALVYIVFICLIKAFQKLSTWRVDNLHNKVNIEAAKVDIEKEKVDIGSAYFGFIALQSIQNQEIASGFC